MTHTFTQALNSKDVNLAYEIFLKELNSKLDQIAILKGNSLTAKTQSEALSNSKTKEDTLLQSMRMPPLCRHVGFSKLVIKPPKLP